MIELQDHQIGTYAKILLQDLTIIRQIIEQKTKLIKEQVKNTEENQDSLFKLLSDRQINEALDGPFQTFFKQHLSAYANIAHLSMALTISKTDLLKSKDFQEEIDYGLPEALLLKKDFPELRQAQQSLDNMTQEHLMLWESQIESWNDLLLSQLAQNNLPLNDIEIQDFRLNETISEINNRFIDLKIEMPKLKKAEFNFEQYYILKLTLTIHSALSRLHQPNTTKDIHHVLQHCHKQLKEVRQAEKKRSEEQQTEIDALIGPAL